jgi:hypothetical protein
MSFFPPGKLAPPRNRMYIKHPTEVFWSNFVKWMPQVQLFIEAFAFLKSDVLNGSAGFSVGMENAFFVWREKIVPGRIMCCTKCTWKNYENSPAPNFLWACPPAI